MPKDASLGSCPLVDPVIDFSRRSRVFMIKVGVTYELGFRIDQSRLLRHKLSLRLLQLRLVLVLLYGEKAVVAQSFTNAPSAKWIFSRT